MAKRLHKDPEFTARIDKARAALGYHYPIFLRSKFPQYSIYKIRNVVHNGVMDWGLLKAMEKVAGIKSVKKQTLNLETA